MNLGSAELFRGNILTKYRLDDARTGKAEEGFIRLDDKASLPGQVTATAGIETEHSLSELGKES